MKSSILIILALVAIPVIIGLVTAAPQPNLHAIEAKTKPNDHTQRETHVFDIKDVEKGGQVQTAVAKFSLSSNIGDRCVLMLNEKHLNHDFISDQFICKMYNEVPINIIGRDALQTKLNSDEFNFVVMNVFTKEFIPITSDSLVTDITYTSPTYFAKIENNKVTTVIVADQDFIATQKGKWIEANPNIAGKNAGIGYTYDNAKAVFIPPQPFPSWTLSQVDWQWHAPVQYPIDGKKYSWNETNREWVLVG